MRIIKKKMGNADTKLNFRKAVIQLTTKTQPVEAGDECFWSQFWSDTVTCVQDVFTLIPAAEIRALREESPSNLATLCYKAVEKLVSAAETSCSTQREQQTALNCVRLLTRILPYIFEDPDWRGFFWSTLPGQSDEEENDSVALAQTLVNSLCDLLFCPDFTVASNRKAGPDNPEDLVSIDSCEYIWEAGVGFAHSPAINYKHDANRTEILKLMLTCFSETMYLPPLADAHSSPNQWINYFTSTENRHALPLFTSLLNIVCNYDPVGYGVPYNHLMFTDSREPLVEVALQLLCVTLENINSRQQSEESTSTVAGNIDGQSDAGGPDNLFVNYLSRIHREEDFLFILHGITKLLNNPLVQTYLPGSTKKIQFYQELFVLFWKMCDINKKFMFFVLKSSDVLEVLVPILFHLNDARADQSRVGLMHIGVFIILLLSGERNFGVRLNKPYSVRVPMDIPVFTGTHADLLIIVFHKIITTGHQRLQPLFDCLLTIIVNISPYLKTLSMVASTKLLHLLEAFSTPWFLFASPTNHHLVFFLLEVFNNIIQYQFDGNANLVYTIIRKRNVFHQLVNLSSDHTTIAKALNKRGKKFIQPITEHKEPQSMEGSFPAAEAEPGTLKVTLAATPGLSHMTEERITANTTSVTVTSNNEKSKYKVNHISGTKNNDATDAPTPPLTLREIAEKGRESSHMSKDSQLKSIIKSAITGIHHMTEQRSPASTPADKGSTEATGGNADAATDKEEDEKQAPDGTDESQSSEPEGALAMRSEEEAINKQPSPPESPASPASASSRPQLSRSGSLQSSVMSGWVPSPEWVQSWKQKLPLQTIMRLLQVLVPQVEKICIDKGLTDESEILKFLQHGTLVGLLPVPHPILIRKYQANAGTTMWFRTYMWGVIYLRNMDPPIWYDTDVKLFEIQRV